MIERGEGCHFREEIVVKKYGTLREVFRRKLGVLTNLFIVVLRFFKYYME